MTSCVGCEVSAPPLPATRIAWRADGVGIGQPAFDGTSVYFLGAAHQLTAVDKATGARRWSQVINEVGAQTDGTSVIVVGEQVIVGDVNVYAFDRLTGAHRWSFRPDDGYKPGIFNLETDGSAIYAGSPSGRVYALDAATGKARWTAVVANDNNTSIYDPKAHEGTVYVCVRHFTNPHTGGLVALNAMTGAQIWSRPFPPEPPHQEGGCRGRAAIAGDLVVGVSTYGYAYGIERSDGAIRWTIPRLTGLPQGALITDFDIRPLAVAGSTIVLGSSTGYVAAFDAATGSERWRARANYGSVYYPLAIDDKQIFALHLGGQLAAFRLLDGNVSWVAGQNSDGSGEFSYSPAVDESLLYIGGVHGLYALRKD